MVEGKAAAVLSIVSVEDATPVATPFRNSLPVGTIIDGANPGDDDDDDAKVEVEMEAEVRRSMDAEFCAMDRGICVSVDSGDGEDGVICRKMKGVETMPD